MAHQLAILGLLIALISFAVGRRRGFTEGCRWAEKRAPLELRELSYKKGSCQLCGLRWQESRAVIENKDVYSREEEKESIS